MIEIDLDASDLDRLERALERVDGMASKRMRTRVELILEMLVNKAVDITHMKDLIGATSAYVNGLQWDLSGRAMNLKGRVFSSAGHNYYVEHGRGPGGFPPIDAIQLWVRRKLAVGSEEEVAAVAYLVGRAIAQRGTIARFGYEGGKVLEETKQKGERDAQRMWRDMVRELVRDIEGSL
jgi:hypothetical protein